MIVVRPKLGSEVFEMRRMEAVAEGGCCSGKAIRRGWERRGVKDEGNEDLLDGYLYVWRTSAILAFHSPTSLHFTQLACIVDP